MVCVCVSGGDAATDSPGSSPLGAEEQEVDVEGVQSALRALHQELRDTKRDRVLLHLSLIYPPLSRNTSYTSSCSPAPYMYMGFLGQWFARESE